MQLDTELDIKRILKWLAGIIAIIITLLIPSLHFYNAYQHKLADITLKAELISNELSVFVFQHPDTWMYQEHRLLGFIEKFLDNKNDSLHLIGMDNEIIVNIEHNHKEPLLTYSTEVKDVNTKVATLTMDASLQSTVESTFNIALISLLLGISVYFTFYLIPLRSLKNTLSELKTTQNKLEQEVLAKEAALQESRAIGQKLHNMAMHDSLTELPNRAMFHDRLKHSLTLAERNKTLVAVVMIDLNHFKEVNDSLGHHAGDLLLIEISERLNKNKRKSDTVARFGGDEFAMILHISNINDCMLVSNKFQQAIREPIKLKDYHVDLTTNGSFGISLFPEHGTDAIDLLKKADIAMYAAKKTSSNIAIYNPAIDHNSPERFKLLSQLSNAIINNELYLVYQPKIDLKTQEVIGVEALIRWNLPGMGFIPPGDFIPWAEQSEVIHPLTEWVLEAALEQQQEWKIAGINLKVSINISGKNLHDPEFHNKVRIAIQKWGANPSDFIMEITESAMIENLDNAKIIINELYDAGVKLSIDDFGTGHASLTQLKNFPFHELKIDRSFVMDMANDSNDNAIVRTAIALSKSLNMTTVAEGIEDERTIAMLSEMGCDYAQGFLICKPLPASELTDWLNSRKNNILKNNFF
ncbi:MAG TPA: EAL domain-containing protein [Gammaproteobacteria bacterium]